MLDRSQLILAGGNVEICLYAYLNCVRTAMPFIFIIISFSGSYSNDKRCVPSHNVEVNETMFLYDLVH